MKRVIGCGLILSALFESAPSFSQVNTINIVGAPKNSDGWGDVISNIWMVQQIKAAHPNITVNFIADPNYHNHESALSSIIPGYDPKRAKQTLNGVAFYNPKKDGTFSELPKADCTLTFSNPLISKAVYEANPHSPYLAFSEYSFGLGGLNPDEPIVERSPGLSIFTKPSSLGMYLSPRLPEPAPSIEGESKAAEMDTRARSEIGFSYASEDSFNIAYVQNMIDYAKENSSQPVVIHVKQPKIAPNFGDIPENLTIRWYKSLPFSRTVELIHSSNLPILVTGDMSATLAVEFEKKFIYETRGHKSEFAFELSDIAEVDTRVVERRGTDLKREIKEKMALWSQSNYERYKRAIAEKRKFLSLPNKAVQMCGALLGGADTAHLKRFYVDLSPDPFEENAFEQRWEEFSKMLGELNSNYNHSREALLEVADQSTKPHATSGLATIAPAMDSESFAPSSVSASSSAR